MPESAIETIKVALGNRSYDILVGANLLEQAGHKILPLLDRPSTIIVTDDNVAEACLERLTDSLSAVGIIYQTIVLPAGEGTKSFQYLESLLDQLLSARIERKDMIIAFGGGVIGDLTGFAASILRRGIDFIQIPTTLLSQVDSSVGGKTGINSRHGKNLIGSFHQPRLVLADTTVLATLPRRQLLAGYAEVVKYGLINDLPFFEWLEDNGLDLLNGNNDALRKAIVKSVEHKANIVASDEHEKGQRALLNLGHTFGHAFEAETAYSDILFHGEAVALGMILAFEVSVEMGICDSNDVKRVKKHLASVGLPTRTSQKNHPISRVDFNVTSLMNHMKQDKKIEAGKMTFILTHGIGKSFVTRDVDLDLVQNTLEQFILAK